ncbi:DUF4396 domain-containing protein [Streptomyces sp. SAJ15]|uniref:DUF4396 domain-containing protein n=1 Tax=Streptomyces sp. SAJ15 TaxID=2011095 RepID=UPI001185E67B|nr:DUF4396 domain-containing protein [Streptomyces sp. SAJ15]TVL91616.1 hypothetical protein CD790_16905 [Streptomyces sp. SAJ15]
MDHSSHHTSRHPGGATGPGHEPRGGQGGWGGDGGHHPGGASWGLAARATLHCLTGCATGEILGMVIGTALRWGNVPTMALAIFLAFVLGYSLTLLAALRAGLGLAAAVKVALAADTVSIVVMEAVDNLIIALTPGAMDAHLTDGLFWAALLGGFAVAFVVTTPVNKWMIGRGRGHAVVHDLH